MRDGLRLASFDGYQVRGQAGISEAAGRIQRSRTVPLRDLCRIQVTLRPVIVCQVAGRFRTSSAPSGVKEMLVETDSFQSITSEHFADFEFDAPSGSGIGRCAPGGRTDQFFHFG